MNEWTLPVSFVTVLAVVLPESFLRTHHEAHTASSPSAIGQVFLPSHQVRRVSFVFPITTSVVGSTQPDGPCVCSACRRGPTARTTSDRPTDPCRGDAMRTAPDRLSAVRPTVRVSVIEWRRKPLVILSRLRPT